jgi:hypothetical protein
MEVHVETSDLDYQVLRQIEEGLWRREARFSQQKMEEILAPDFFEYGRSGRVYSRTDCLAVSPQDIDAVLPLIDFDVRMLSADVAQVTYRSVVRYGSDEQHALRSSIWSRTDVDWQLRFHQGTPIPNPVNH